MELLIDFLIVYGLISVCIMPILLVVFLVKHTEMFIKLYNKVLKSEINKTN